MFVEMTETERRIAQFIAKCRDAACRSNNVTDKQQGNQDPSQIEYDGILSEMAVAKKLNLYPDFTTQVRKGGYDLLWGDKRVDVKSTRYNNVILCISITKPVDACDLYISTRITTDDNVEMIGCIESDKAIHADNVGDLGHGKCYVIDVGKLRKF
jgi:hypothetical protein